MMAYDDGYALCVLHDGSPVREIHGKVSIPFYSEYKVRLKNKNNQRAKARVWIDGRKVSNLGDFILQPGQTLDLERFLDHDLDTGHKFKFVPLSDSRVNDPTDSNNGIVKVEFYREREWIKIDWNWTKTPIQPRDNDWHTIDYKDYWIGSNPTWVGWNSNLGTIRSSLSNITHDCCYFSKPSEGATVEGGISNQKFVEGGDFLTEDFPTTLTLKITAINKEVMAPKQRNPKKNVRYCSVCGRRRQRRADKFCSRCGTRY